MNWADLTSVVIVLTSGLCGVAAAHSGGAPWWLQLLSLVMAIAFGVGVALLSGKLAYAALARESRGLNAKIALFLYMISPIVFLAAGCTFTVIAVEWFVKMFT